MRRRIGGALLTLALHVLLLVLCLTDLRQGRTGTPEQAAPGPGGLVMVSLNDAVPQKAPTRRVRPPLLRNDPHSQKIIIPAALPQSDRDDAPLADTATGSAAPGAGIPTDTSPNGAAAAFQKRLLAHIETYRREIPLWRRERGSGHVDVLFTMGRSGIVLGIWIAHSSGSPHLDKEALATVLRAQPLPRIPAELPDPLNVSLPVVFDRPS